MPKRVALKRGGEERDAGQREKTMKGNGEGVRRGDGNSLGLAIASFETWGEVRKFIKGSVRIRELAGGGKKGDANVSA